MASDKNLNYHSGLWLLLSHIIVSQHAPDSNMIVLKIVKCMANSSEKMDFAGLVNDAQSVAGCFPSRQFRVGRNDVT